MEDYPAPNDRGKALLWTSMGGMVSVLRLLDEAKYQCIEMATATS